LVDGYGSMPVNGKYLFDGADHVYADYRKGRRSGRLWQSDGYGLFFEVRGPRLQAFQTTTISLPSGLVGGA
jgi:hypothetical protein